jgi:hypothetical protein
LFGKNRLITLGYINKCKCGNIIELEVDHIIPRFKGGTDELSNLQVLCKICHNIKSKKEWDEARKKKKVITKSNESVISQTVYGQKITTIPKAIAGAVNFKNKDKIEWLFDKGDLIVRKK